MPRLGMTTLLISLWKHGELHEETSVGSLLAHYMCTVPMNNCVSPCYKLMVSAIFLADILYSIHYRQRQCRLNALQITYSNICNAIRRDAAPSAGTPRWSCHFRFLLDRFSRTGKLEHSNAKSCSDVTLVVRNDVVLFIRVEGLCCMSLTGCVCVLRPAVRLPALVIRR